jgi:transcriptional regulator with XRE-family HTH domain
VRIFAEKIILLDYFFIRYIFRGKGVTMAETLGDRLARIRGYRRMSQQDLADRTGLKVQNISRLETDHREHVRSDTLVRLADGLQVSTDYLLGRTNDPTPPTRRVRGRVPLASLGERVSFAPEPQARAASTLVATPQTRSQKTARTAKATARRATRKAAPVV